MLKRQGSGDVLKADDKPKFSQTTQRAQNPSRSCRLRRHCGLFFVELEWYRQIHLLSHFLERCAGPGSWLRESKRVYIFLDDGWIGKIESTMGSMGIVPEVYEARGS